MTQKTIELAVRFKVPKVPNFLLRAVGEGCMDVGLLHGDEIDVVVEAWADALRTNVIKRRQALEDEGRLP